MGNIWSVQRGKDQNNGGKFAFYDYIVAQGFCAQHSSPQLKPTVNINELQ